jgi:hypothetical protein
VLLAFVLAAASLAACGGKSSGEVKSTLDKAFSTPVKSASMDLEFTIEGEGLKQPAKLSITGPYEQGPAKSLFKADWVLAVAGAGQNFSFTSTGDNSWLGFAGQNYEVGKSTTADLAKALPHFSSLRNWLADPKDEGSSKIGGVETEHISAGLDTGRVLDDVQRALKSANNKNVPQISAEQRKRFEDFVKKTRFDVYVGKADNVIRRLSTTISFTVPKDQQTAGSLKNGTLSLSIQFTNVGKPQTIKAPAKSQPLTALTSQFGGLAGIVGGAAAGAGGGSSGSGSSGGSSAAGGDALQQYAECLRNADPNDAAQMQKCNSLVK